MKGCSLGITREHTVWCSTCNAWNQQAEPNRARFARDMKAIGWTLKQGSWRCPVCSKAASKDDANTFTKPARYSE